jgi:hypothetical protein
MASIEFKKVAGPYYEAAFVRTIDLIQEEVAGQFASARTESVGAEGRDRMGHDQPTQSAKP